MPPGSPGIFRRKSSTEISPHATIIARSSAGADDSSEIKMAATASATSLQTWPNQKDDYELKEVIG
jgi:hypothetical protein